MKHLSDILISEENNRFSLFENMLFFKYSLFCIPFYHWCFRSSDDQIHLPFCLFWLRNSIDRFWWELWNRSDQQKDVFIFENHKNQISEKCQNYRGGSIFELPLPYQNWIPRKFRAANNWNQSFCQFSYSKFQYSAQICRVQKQLVW